MAVIEHEPEFVAETLAWCNEMRAEKGMGPLARLPKGKRRDGASCPCGAATGLHVGSHFTYVGRKAVRELPGGVTEFVLAFDLGDLPQYDIYREVVA